MYYQRLEEFYLILEIIVFVQWEGEGLFFGVIIIVSFFSSTTSVIGLEKSLMFGSEGKGSIDGRFLRSGETLASAGEEKLVSIGVDGNIGGIDILGVMGGKGNL